VMTPVRKVAFSGRNLRDKWLFEARSNDFLGQAFGGASRVRSADGSGMNFKESARSHVRFRQATYVSE